MKVLIAVMVFAVAGPAWSQTEIERDLDGNSTVFLTETTPQKQTQTTPQKPGGPDARR